MALGIARWKINLHIVLKTASKGIITGALLAVARAAGETAPLIFTTLGNSNLNWNPARPTAALPLQIYQDSQMPVRGRTRERTYRSTPGKPEAPTPAAAATTAAVTGGAAVAAQ